MKISRPPSPQLPGSPAKATGIAGSRGKGFATSLEKANSTKANTTAGPAKASAPRKVADVSDLGAALTAGKITPEAAINKVVERILDRQLGKNAPAAIRQKVGEALRESLADDPLLAAKVQALGRD